MGLALHSLPEPVDFSAEKQRLLDALDDGLLVYQHFGHLFCSGSVRLLRNYDTPFPTDKKYRKGFRLYQSQTSGRIQFKCNATARQGDCFLFVMELMRWSFKDTREYFQQVILHGLPLREQPNAQLVVRPRLVLERETSILTWPREWEAADEARYELVGIDAATRARYHCYALKAANVITSEHNFMVHHSAASPLYGYWYEQTNHWKINQPLQPKGQGQKWYASTKGPEDLFAQHLLPPAEAPLPLGLIGAGQRDSMAVAALLGHAAPVHALNSESAHLTADQYGLLRSRYQRLAFFTDPDQAGAKGAAHLVNAWGLPTLNHVLHPILGELDICDWLAADLGRLPRARARLAELLSQAAFGISPTF